MASWQVQQAKSRLSELIEKANSEGPQTITKHGVDAAVLLSIDEFKKLKGEDRTLIDLLLGGPKFDDEDMPNFERDRTHNRNTDGLFDD